MRRWTLALLIAALFSARSQAQTSRFGLVAGREWVYDGRAAWTTPQGRVERGRMRWIMRCLTVRSVESVRVALVRGWVQGSAWYEPSAPATYAVLIESSERLRAIQARDSATAVDSMNSVLGAGNRAGEHGELLVDSALAPGHVYGAITDRGPRDDDFYEWRVEDRAPIPVHAPWRSFASSTDAWRLAYRTLPDTQTLEFVPGVGITRFTYSHHGTTADTDLRLAAVRNSAP